MRLLLLSAALWFGVHWLYVVAMAAKQAVVADKLTTYLWVMLAPAALLGLVLDVAFNVIFGTIVFRELPREWLFTSRCRRHIQGAGSRQRMARWWAKQLNPFDQGHIS